MIPCLAKPFHLRVMLPAALALALGVWPVVAQEIPAGWEVRPDRGDHAQHGAAPEGLEFVTMPPGWHITTGPAVILWEPGTTATGDYRVEADIHLFDPAGRREAFGVFIGGSDLHGEGQRYSYFLLRDGGQFLVKRRAGVETPTVVDWTAAPSMRTWATRGDGGSVLNNITVEVRGDRVRMLVNGEEVSSVPRSQLDTEGIVGLRVNHSLNLHVSRLEVTPIP
jgi:hypothetical protein